MTFQMVKSATAPNLKLEVYDADHIPQRVLLRQPPSNQNIPSFVAAPINLDFTVNFTKSGEYKLIVPYPQRIALYNYTLNLLTSCQNQCFGPTHPVSTCTANICGDGILYGTEICDNGNRLGCSRNCQVDTGYTCQGQIGGTSYCTKIELCGDAIVDAGEQCDNGNKLGCSKNCQVDTGYTCQGQTGSSSYCSKAVNCGDAIVDVGEQYDNGNKAGCSTGCNPDSGYACTSDIGKVSVCNNCGNGILEGNEQCDNGNKVG